MPHTVLELLDAARELSEDKRAELAEMIEATLEYRPDSLHAAWTEEIRRRVDEMDSGKAVLVPWEEVRERIHKKLNARDPQNA